MRIMKKYFAIISGASLLLSVGLTNPPAAYADSGCRNATIAGSFGIQTTGTILEGGPVQPGPIATTGLISFDGNGNSIERQTISFNGTIVPFEASGTYKVEKDCTITLKATDPGTGTQITASGVIVKRGTEIMIIETSPNTLITGTLKKIE